MWTRCSMLAALALAAALSGCSDEPPPALATKATRSCHVTLPGGAAPDGFNYGDESLAVALWPKGGLLAGSLPDGSAWAEIAPDGSIEAKLGWWRGVEGRLSVEGERLDAAAPPLRAHVPDGYGPSGFQPTGLTFPAEGCWEVRGRVGEARVAFVVRVRKLRGGR